MKNFLYKLVFPECGKLYFGRATNESRYGNNKPNQQFFGPHHNRDVQKLLDEGEFCFFIALKEFQIPEELAQAEKNFLQKVWKTDTWKSRPAWLLNRNRNSVGFTFGELNPVHKLSPEKLKERAENMRQSEKGKVKAKKTWEKNRNDPNFVHANTGRPRPDMQKPQTEKQKTAAKNAQLRTKPCPNCGREMNAGNLSQHIKRGKCFKKY